MTTLKDKLSDITSGLSFFLPEITLSAGIVLLLLLGFFPHFRKGAILKITCMLILLLAMVLDIQQWIGLTGQPRELFVRMLILDKLSVFWKFLFELGGIITVLMGFGKKQERESEYYTLILAITLGAHLLSMAGNLLMVFLAIELLSISAYVLTTFNFNRAATEGGIKYLLFGAASSAVMIYGMSWLYALAGSLNFIDQQFAGRLMDAASLPLIIAGVLVLGGIFFKISAAPMHIWTPDVYTAAPTPIAAFFSVVPKMAGFAVLMRWLLVINLFGQGPVEWSTVLAVMAMITITIGNFSALWQQNVKRILAYSSVAHSGFLMIGLVFLSELAMESLMFYAAVYLIMNMAAFWLVNSIEKQYGFTGVKDYGGFVKRSAFITVLMVVVMIALTGLPPTAGFTAKLMIFTALWEGYTVTNNDWLLYLMIFGLANTVISLFFYLKMPYYMIFRTAAPATGSPENIYTLENFLGTIMVLALFVIFFKPDVLMRIINSISFAF